MKAVSFLLILLLFAGCANRSKDITQVSKGMSKQEVIAVIGEPSHKKDIEVAELWDYPAYNKTIIFRKDTVYDWVVSSSAQIDSIKDSFKDLGTGIRKGIKKIGSKLDTVTKKLENKRGPDSLQKSRRGE